MNVQSIIGTKGIEVATIAQTANLGDVVRTLGEHRIGALVVSGDGRVIEGIISERDIGLGRLTQWCGGARSEALRPR